MNQSVLGRTAKWFMSTSKECEREEIQRKNYMKNILYRNVEPLTKLFSF